MQRDEDHALTVAIVGHEHKSVGLAFYGDELIMDVIRARSKLASIMSMFTLAKGVPVRLTYFKIERT